MTTVTAISEVRNALTAMQPQFQMTLPNHISVEKFTRTALTAIQGNPKLLESNRQSLFACCMNAAHDGHLLDGR